MLRGSCCQCMAHEPVFFFLFPFHVLAGQQPYSSGRFGSHINLPEHVDLYVSFIQVRPPLIPVITFISFISLFWDILVLLPSCCCFSPLQGTRENCWSLFLATTSAFNSTVPLESHSCSPYRSISSCSFLTCVGLHAQVYLNLRSESGVDARLSFSLFRVLFYVSEPCSGSTQKYVQPSNVRVCTSLDLAELDVCRWFGSGWRVQVRPRGSWNSQAKTYEWHIVTADPSRSPQLRLTLD